VKPLKVAVFADAGQVQKFARDALDAVEGCDEVTVFSCSNTHRRKQAVRHGFYYALNLLSVRNAETRGVPVGGGAKGIADTVEFESEYDGVWQRLPADMVARLREGGFDVILKFGLGLLRVPPAGELPVPILSYHHGDPDHYRGRPAGFWETADGKGVMGQIVQVIGNKLDAGRVVAFAETKVHAHSYKATLVEAFRHSPLIINQAIRNAIGGVSLDKPCNGRNCRLPSNLTVARFLLRMGKKKAGRLVYGALYEKKWQVSLAPAPSSGAAALFDGSPFPGRDAWQTIETASQYTFYADPFFSSRPPGLLVEALSRRTGLGEIVLIEDELHRRVSDFSGHASYPATFGDGAEQLVIPETASWLPATAFRSEGDRLVPAFALDLPAGRTILDPTLVTHGGRVYLFGNLNDVGSNILYLWSATAIDAPFEPHPASPILVSPRGGRMGGSILRDGDRLIRLGQDFEGGYGDGLRAFEIEALSESEYRERPIGYLGLDGVSGPHTLNVQGGMLLFDWYRESFSLGAGLRRFRARRATKRALKA